VIRKKRVPFVDDCLPLDAIRSGTRTRMIKNTVHSQFIRILIHMYLSLLQSNHLILIWIGGVETHIHRKKKETHTQREREREKKTQHRALSLSMIT
jgi:predicted small integral membrane protein